MDGIATLVLYDEFNDVKNTGDTQYPSYRPAATLTIHGGATLTVGETGAIAGQIVLAKDATEENYAKVSLNRKTATSVTSYEANGYCNGTIPLNFSLALFDANGSKSALAVTPGWTYYGTGAAWTNVNPKKSSVDLNGDDVVNSLDLNLLLANYLNSGDGDINGDDVVNSLDLNLLLEHYLETQS
jgi:hypothetical protein